MQDGRRIVPRKFWADRAHEEGEPFPLTPPYCYTILAFNLSCKTVRQFLSPACDWGLMQAHESLIRHQFRIILVPGRKDKALAEHREMLIYIKQHDAVGAEQAIRHHMVQLRRSLQQASHLPSG